jgi:4-alpha-glucanotransferase
MTMRQWFDSCSEEAKSYAVAYMNLSEKEGYVWGAIRTAMSCVSNLCIIPMQDYLDLGKEARMNFPGTMSDSNWTWRAKDGIITNNLAQKIREITALYGRMGNQI